MVALRGAKEEDVQGENENTRVPLLLSWKHKSCPIGVHFSKSPIELKFVAKRLAYAWELSLIRFIGRSWHPAVSKFLKGSKLRYFSVLGTQAAPASLARSQPK